MRDNNKSWMSTVALIMATTVTGCTTTADTTDGTSGVDENSQVAAGAAQQPFCVTTAAAATSEAGLADSDPALLAEPECFDTFSSAIAAATDGGVQLPPSATVDSVDEQTVNGSAAALVHPIIAFEYKNIAFDTRVLIVRSPDGRGCLPGRVLGRRTLPAVANNDISAARAFAGCHHSFHFDLIRFHGANIDCHTACSYIGDAMNDRTSSIAWTN
jgi:hypothetical protein